MKKYQINSPAFLLLILLASTLSGVAYGQGIVIRQSDFTNRSVQKEELYDRDSFLNNADFTRDTFYNAVDFSNSVFKGDVHFMWNVFYDYVGFSDVVFGPRAYFNLMELNNKTVFDFYHCTLPDTIDLADNPVIINEIDLTDAKYPDSSEKKYAIYLYKTDVSKFRLDYRYFKLLFADPVDKSRVLSPDEKEAIYESLLKNFKDRGQLESYRILDLEYQEFKWRRSTYFGWMKIFPEYWWNYGYNKEYVFYWAGVFLLLFTLINFFFLDFLNDNVYKMENIPPTSYEKKIERLWYSLVYSATLFFTFSLRNEKINFKSRLGALYIMMIFLIGILCIAYMANFVLQK